MFDGGVLINVLGRLKVREIFFKGHLITCQNDHFSANKHFPKVAMNILLVLYDVLVIVQLKV